jgi:hypothetical protein
MKKLFVIACMVLFLGSMLFSCKSSGTHCQAYSKINKVQSEKTEKAL